MADTLWGEREAGSNVSVGSDAAGSYAVVGDPDWVRTPPELGSEKLRVERVYARACPCGGAHEARTYDLQASDLHVSDCSERGFLWWRAREKEEGV